MIASTLYERADPIPGFDAPASRKTDPSTSAAAAEGIKPANAELCEAIRAFVRAHGPSTSWEIATGVQQLHGARWQFDSIRTACARADLTKLEGWGLSPGGRTCCLYTLERQYDRVDPVDVRGGVL